MGAKKKFVPFILEGELVTVGSKLEVTDRGITIPDVQPSETFLMMQEEIRRQGRN